MFGEVNKLLSEFRKFNFPTINSSISMTDSFDHAIFKNMAILINLGWFYFAKCLLFLFRIMAQHIFRIHMEDCSEKEMKISPTELESSDEEHEPEVRIFDAFSEEEEEEEEPSTFRFKFEYQIPNLDTKFSKDRSVFTNENNNQFPHEKEISGFVEEESVASFQVHEPFSKTEELDTKLAPNENFEISKVVNNNSFAVNKDFNDPTKESKISSSLAYESYSKTREDKVKIEKPIISNYRVSPQKDICGFVESSSTASCRYSSCLNSIHEDNMEFDKARTSNYQYAPSKDLNGHTEESSVATFQIHESSINGGDSSEEVTNFEKPIVGSHQALPKKDFVVFTEESKPMSFQVHETLIDTAEKELNSEIMNKDAKGSHFHTSQVDEPSISRSDSSEEVTDFEKPIVSSHQSSLKKNFIFLTEEPNAMSFQVPETSIDTTEKELDSQEMEENTQGSKHQTFQFLHDFTENTEENSYHDMPKNNVSKAIEENTTYEAYEPTINFDEFFPFGNPIMQTQDVQFVRDQKRKDEVVGSFVDFGSDSDSSSFSDNYSVKILEVDLDKDGFLSEDDFVEDKDSIINSSTFDMELGVEDQTTNTNTKNCSNCANMFDSFFSEKELDKIEKFTKGKLEEYQTFCAENYSPYTENISETESLEQELEELNAEDAEEYEIPSKSTVQLELTDSSDDEIPYAKDAEKHLKNKMELNESSENTEVLDMYDEDVDELESLWEHQDLIEQLKMEIKRVKAIGLPTIFEESEAPKTFEDLKPWKIDAKFLREDPINELHKFYKSYSERMRKLDILNYQKMYAISFLQLKNPLEFMGANKPLIPTLMSCLSQNLSRKKSSIKPSDKFLKELQIELETIYVGQMCLSWEFLLWQYEKIRELLTDNHRKQQYNQVAAEFQQFQVVLQRFVENESFQGPRLQNYVQNRCMHRNLLQVPVVKEDCFKDKIEELKKGNGAITREMLEDIIEESISLFWEFVKGDKDETSVIIKGLLRNQTELQDPSDFALMENIQESLQKKEKRLKDILKTGNCIVKKFKKAREADRSNQDLFFSQVDIKLISRVLKMSYITSDQLVWCHNKLNKITFKYRKIQRESSFLLFPC